MREQMLDEDPAKCKVWSAESSALIYTTGTLKLHIIDINYGITDQRRTNLV